MTAQTQDERVRVTPSARRERYERELARLLGPGAFLGPKETQALLGAPEDEGLERKSVWDRRYGKRRRLRPRSVRFIIAECGAAFANTAGGILLVGVDDDGTPSGHGYDLAAMVSFIETARTLAPGLSVEAQLLPHPNGEILALRFGVSADVVTLGDGGEAPYRVGATVRRVPSELVRSHKELQRLRTRSAQRAA